MMIRQDTDAIAKADLFGDAAQSAKDGVLAGRARKAGEEVVLDEPQVVEAHLVGEFTLRQGFFVQFVPVNLRPFELTITHIDFLSVGPRASPRPVTSSHAGHAT